MSCGSLLRPPAPTSGHATCRIYHALLLCFSVNCSRARALPLSRPAPRFVHPSIRPFVHSYTRITHPANQIKMKVFAYAAVLLGLASTALGQAETIAPSPTESYGCEPHGDHWHCEGARTVAATDAATDSVTTTAAAATTSAAHDHDHDDDEDDHDHDDDDHTDAAGTGSLAPSPTESYGCEPHGDHWHCEGAITASTTVPPTGTGAQNAATTTSSSTAGAAHFEVAGLGFAGIAAVAAMAL
jgi:hypothetical protein